jgi:hypothetical protein
MTAIFTPNENANLETWKSAYFSLSAEFTKAHQELIQTYRELTRISQELLCSKQQMQELLQQNQALAVKVTSLEEEVTYLKEQLKLVQQQHFGNKSEKDIGESITPGQLLPPITVSGYTRKRATKSCGRLLDTSSLPRYKIYHDLLDAGVSSQLECFVVHPCTPSAVEQAGQLIYAGRPASAPKSRCSNGATTNGFTPRRTFCSLAAP